MITAYKFLTPNLTSYNDFKWEIGETYTIDKPGNTMCSRDVFHCYNHPLLAEFMMPLHLDHENDYDLYKIEVPEFVNSDGLKFASKSQKVIEKVERPVIINEQRIEIAIRVAKLVCKDVMWNEWADKWLSGEDRSRETAYADIDCNFNAYAAYSYAASAYAASAYARSAASHAASSAAKSFPDKDEFNKKIIEIIESVVKE